MEAIHCSSLTKTKTVKTKVRSVFNVVSQCHSKTKTQGEKKTQVSSLCDIASLRCTKTKTRRRPVSIALRHLLLFHRRARTQAEEAEQQKLEMETLAERLVEADKRGDVAEKGFDDHKIYEK